MPTVLVVDDEESFVASLKLALGREGYKVLVAHDGPSAVGLLEREKVDIILLDLMLPGMSGLDVCRIIRQKPGAPGIIMVTAKSSDIDAIVGLETGADDYVAKPFNMSLLLARMRALLRRQRRLFAAENVGSGRKIIFGALEIDTAAYEVHCDGRPVDLSPRLFDVLVYLARREGEVVNRDDLLNNVWGYDFAGETRTVDVHLHWLREHLTNSGCPDMIQTIRGVGYKFVAPKASGP
jgi:DNA-binding response OmpR family regulator